MKWSYKVLKLKGIDIKVHLTFGLILIWAAYRWSSSTGTGWEGALFGIVATLLLFVSVTLHEMGHSLQAQKFGVHVRDITLMPIGGLAQLEKIPEESNKELRIALAGPLVNLTIAGLLIAVGAIFGLPAVFTPEGIEAAFSQISWSSMLAYLTLTNLMLGLFNLIPAFPMDGGRVLRALLAKRMPYARATKIAAQVGQTLAFLLGFWGVLSGSWTLMLIAIFVWMGAGQENQDVQVKSTLGNTTAIQAMTRSPYTLKANDPLYKAIELTLSTSQADFPVLEWGTTKVVGMLTEADLLRGLQSLGVNTPVREIMQTHFSAVSPDELLHTIQSKMQKEHTNALPVLTVDNELLGLLTAADVNEAYRLMLVNPELAASAQ